MLSGQAAVNRRFKVRYSSVPRTSTLSWQESEDFLPVTKSDLYSSAGKRLVDILISSLVILFVLSWVIPIISLFILFDSRGPIFFIQPRTGRRGITFPCFKFRTMQHQPAAQRQREFKQTVQNDKRVTRTGRFLRRTNLDELPQFINVLLGDMSIVGPRPHAVQHDAFYWESREYRSRYSIKPGITGLAQIRGSRGETEQDQKMFHRVKYDLFYASRKSLKLDTAIFFWTIGTMVKGDKNAW
ncbi:sugar transferase [Spirosoma rhododendri]|nr:sugar transferase [Spirosoma rhododendri]